MNWIRNIFFMTAGKCMSILRCMVSQFLDMLLSIEKYHATTLIISSRKKILLRLKVNDSASHLLKSLSMDVVSCDVINAQNIDVKFDFVGSLDATKQSLYELCDSTS